ncbi:MAG: helix-turn-helix domain-containing protein [Eubacteriales bacterium]
MEYYSNYFGEIDAVLTVQEAQELLCIGRNTIYTLLTSGKLKGFKAGKTWRVTAKMLDEFMEGKDNAER